MKKIALIISCVALMAATVGAKADNIDESQARNVAAAYMASLNGQKVPDFSSVELVKTYVNPATGDNTLYLFNVGDLGYAVVSGSTATEPVLTYSTENNLNPELLADDHPFASWMQYYADQVAIAQVEELQADEAKTSDWNTLAEGRTLRHLASKAGTKILMSTAWSQSRPYNDSCPIYSGGNRSVVGCVPLGVGMVMRYWEYPVRPRGTSYSLTVSGETYMINYDSVSYVYKNMPSQLVDRSDAKYKSAVQQFLFHCGMAVRVNYTSNATGANMYYVGEALANNYKYPKKGDLDSNGNVIEDGFERIYRRAYGNDEWIRRMKAEILAQHPIIYAASDANPHGDHSGHCFVIDGYDFGTGKFHVNWGWGSGSSTWCDFNEYDGLVNNSYTYSISQEAFVNVHPPVDTIRVTFPERLEDLVVSTPALNDNSGSNATMGGTTLDAIYPAPATANVTIPYTLAGTSNDQIDIYNAQGVVVRSIAVTDAADKATLDVQGLPAGVYTARLQTSIRKFVVK